jgi:hypothetical protein
MPSSCSDTATKSFWRKAACQVIEWFELNEPPETVEKWLKTGTAIVGGLLGLIIVIKLVRRFR